MRAIVRLDSCLASVFAAIRQANLEPDLWVVCGGPGHKGDEGGLFPELAEPRIRVPLLLGGTAIEGAPSAGAATASLVDIAATFLGQAKALRQPQLHGTSLLDLARAPMRAGAVVCQSRGGTAVAVVRYPLKLIQASDTENPPPGLTAGPLLLDLATDPLEATNLVEEKASSAIDLAGEWTRLVGETIPRFRPLPLAG